MLSPRVADNGIAFKELKASDLENFELLFDLSNACSEKPTRSILFAATTSFTSNNEAINKCRLDCSINPLVASTSIAISAIDAAVTILRAYSLCPGVSAKMNLRLSVVKKRLISIVIPALVLQTDRPSTKQNRFRFLVLHIL